MDNIIDRQIRGVMVILVKDKIHLTSWAKISLLAFKVSDIHFVESSFGSPLFYLILKIFWLFLDFQQFGQAFG